MEIDLEYYKGIHDWLQKQDNVILNIDELTDNYEKFIFHIKHYIDNRTPDDIEIELNSFSESEVMHGCTTHTQIRVLEFFESKIRDNAAALSALTYPIFNEAEIKRKAALQEKWDKEAAARALAKPATVVTPELKIKGLFQ